MPDRAKAPASSTMAQTPLATIRIGPDATKYYVYKALICSFSAYFERVFRGPGFAETTLKDVQPGIFNIFVDWMYSGGALPKEWREGVDVKRVLMEAVVFGHRFSAPKFEAAVHNELVDLLIDSREAARWADVAYLIKNLPDHHVLRNLLVEQHRLYGVEVLPDKEVQAHGIILRGFWRRVLDDGFLNPNLSPQTRNVCEWHIHENEEEAQGCGRE
jgi:hypothetical protein